MVSILGLGIYSLQVYLYPRRLHPSSVPGMDGWLSPGKGSVGTRGYYGVLPSDRIVPYIHGVYNIVPL